MSSAHGTRPHGLRIAALLSVLVIILAACTGNGDTGEETEGEVTLRYVDRLTSPGQSEFLNWAVDTFNEQNEGRIQVEFEQIPVNDFWSQMPLTLRSDNPPDVFFSYEGGWARDMVESEWAEPLDAYYEEYGWSENLNSAGRGLASFDGSTWFVPYRMAAAAVWYNTEIFDQVGVEPPQTWEEFLEVSERFKEEGIAPLMIGNQHQWEAQFNWSAHFVNSYGVDAYNGLINREIPWTDQRVVDTFAALKEMRDQELFMEPVNQIDFDSTADVHWNRECCAMWYQGSFILGKWLDEDGQLTQPIDWFPYPQIGNQEPTIEIFAEDNLMINRNSEHKDAAAEFVDFVVSEEAQAKMVDTMGAYPSNVHVPLDDAPAPVQRLNETAAGYDQSTFMHPDHALPTEVWTPFLRELQAVLEGEQTPDEAARLTEEAAERRMGPVE